MAAIDMWIPFITKPTRSPYLVSLSTTVSGVLELIRRVLARHTYPSMLAQPNQASDISSCQYVGVNGFIILC